MSHLAEKRAAFKTVMDTVAGVKGHTHQPKSPKAGDSWPVLGTVQRDDSGFFSADWYLAVYLPQDERSASMWVDSHVDQIIDALEQHQVAYVDSYDPVNLGDDSSLMYGLLLTMRSE